MKHMASNCVVVFHFPLMCVLMLISFWPTCVSTNYTFATVYKGRHTKEMSVIDEPAHVAVGLQLLERVLSQHLTNNFECLRKVHFSESFNKKNIGNFTDLR